MKYIGHEYEFVHKMIFAPANMDSAYVSMRIEEEKQRAVDFFPGFEYDKLNTKIIDYPQEINLNGSKIRVDKGILFTLILKRPKEQPIDFKFELIEE